MSESNKGSLALVVLTILYGAYGVYNRLIGETFGVFSQQWLRNALVAVLAIIILLVLKQRFVRIRSTDIKWIVLWLLSGSWIMIALFLAFNHLQLSTVYFLFYSTMIVSGVMCGKIFFGERLTMVKITSVMFSMFGLIFIYSLSIKPSDYLYVGFSLAAGLILGFWNSISKKFSGHYSELQLVFWDAIASALVGFIGFLLVKETLPSLTISMSWIWLVIYALTQVCTVGLLVYGFKHLEAQIASVILPVEIIWATIFGFLIFGETLSTGSIIGGALIASGAFLPNMQLLMKYVQKK